MSNYKPIDSKREEFRKYLERTGVMDALTKALVALYEETEKPDDAIGYVRGYLGGGGGIDELIRGQTEGSVLKEGGDQPGSSRKMDGSFKSDSARPMGAEGDGPFAKNPANEESVLYGDEGGKPPNASVLGDEPV